MLGNFSFVVEGAIAGCAYPKGTPEEVTHAISKAGFKTVINLTENAHPAASALQAAGIQAFHIPVADFNPPTMSDMQQVSDIVANSANHPILMHCQAGIGRTGTMLAVGVCTLKHNGHPALEKLTADGGDVVSYVRKIRPSSLEVKSQEEAYKNFESAFLGRK